MQQISSRNIEDRNNKIGIDEMEFMECKGKKANFQLLGQLSKCTGSGDKDHPEELKAALGKEKREQ